jgi:hypothetical protein
MLFDNLVMYALFHPTFVNTSQTPACFITREPFPESVQVYKPFPGHLDVWQMFVPLIPTPDAIIQDLQLRMYTQGPYIAIAFFDTAFRQVDKAELEIWILEAKALALAKGRGLST